MLPGRSINVLFFVVEKGLSNEIVLVIQRHATRNTLDKVAILQVFFHTKHPYLFPNMMPGSPFDKKDIPTGSNAMLTTMSLAVIKM